MSTLDIAFAKSCIILLTIHNYFCIIYRWYGVPGTKADSDGVERVFKNYLSMKLRDVPDLIHHITTFFSPRLLNQEGVKVCKLLQNEGEFIVTFPRAFHGGYSLGPNVGEAVNFALHDWIPHAVEANERYRTFARPSVFSHDRLVYTIAHHTHELRTKEICNAVSMELRRLMGEELLLRTKLIRSGVRDVSQDVDLPPNRLDQLDEESADYDDKRLCHSCKHICFFSAVACECSESKVSCLRHSHYMCRCAVNRKYLLIWTTEQEMKDTISKVEKRGEELGPAYPSAPLSDNPQGSNVGSAGKGPLEEQLQRDKTNHLTFEVPVEPICSLEPVFPPLVSSDISCSSSVDPPSLREEAPQQPQHEEKQQDATADADLAMPSTLNETKCNSEPCEVCTNNTCESDTTTPSQAFKSSTSGDQPPPDSNPCPTQQIDVIFKPSEISKTFKGLQQVDGNSLDDDFSA